MKSKIEKYHKVLCPSGKASFCLTIPKNIIKRNNWDNENLVKIILKDNQIIISEYDNDDLIRELQGEKTFEVKKININEGSKGNFMYRVLIPSKFLKELSVKENQHYILRDLDNYLTLEKIDF